MGSGPGIVCPACRGSDTFARAAGRGLTGRLEMVAWRERSVVVVRALLWIEIEIEAEGEVLRPAGLSLPVVHLSGARAAVVSRFSSEGVAGGFVARLVGDRVSVCVEASLLGVMAIAIPETSVAIGPIPGSEVRGTPGGG